MPNELTPPKVVNLLKNVPMTPKQRSQLIYQFLRRQKPEIPFTSQLKIAESLLPMWQQHSQLALDEVWDLYRNGIREQEAQAVEVAQAVEELEEEEETSIPSKESFSLDIVLNPMQQMAVEYAKAGKSFVLTGPAGTGKTTAERAIVRAIWEAGNYKSHAFRDKRSARTYPGPGIAVVSFTNKAANTSRKAIHRDEELAEELPHNITTIHNLLEFAPVFFERADGTTGMKFEPRRNEFNPIDCSTIIIEEASTVGALDLYQHLYRALRPNTTLIFVGDINQLPPIFSPSILNYALVQLPVVELTEIYRQAQDSPIISNAHRILRGESLQEARPHFTVVSGKHLPKMPGMSFCVQKLVKSLAPWSLKADPTANGELIYDPEQDIILTPYNKSDLGTKEINNHIAQFLGLRREAVVHHIIAGIHQHYLAVGDRVYFFKKEAVITAINKHGGYIGKKPKEPAVNLTRWGIMVHTGQESKGGKPSPEDYELEMEGYENMNVDDIPDEQTKQAASHIVHIQYIDDDVSDTIETSGEFAPANFSLGYALTCHKAQGSEWRKVFVIFHRNQLAHLNREWLYTAVTRARTHAMIIDFCDMSNQVIQTQRIKGNSVQDKIAWFNSEVSLKEPVQVLK